MVGKNRKFEILISFKNENFIVRYLLNVLYK